MYSIKAGYMKHIEWWSATLILTIPSSQNEAHQWLCLSNFHRLKVPDKALNGIRIGFGIKINFTCDVFDESSPLQFDVDFDHQHVLMINFIRKARIHKNTGFMCTSVIYSMMTNSTCTVDAYHELLLLHIFYWTATDVLFCKLTQNEQAVEPKTTTAFMGTSQSLVEPRLSGTRSSTILFPAEASKAKETLLLEQKQN